MYRYLLFLSGLFPCLAMAQTPWDTLVADSVTPACHFFSTEISLDTTVTGNYFWLGEIPHGRVAKIRMFLHNPYPDTVYIESFKTSTGCNAPQWETLTMAPGSTQWLTITDICISRQALSSHKSATVAFTLDNHKYIKPILYGGYSQ